MDTSIANLAGITNIYDNQYQYKDPSGIMILASSFHAMDVVKDDATSGGYAHTITFREPFVKINPIILTGQMYGQGYADTGCLSVNLTGCKIGCKAKPQNYWVTWIAIGVWK